MIEQVIYEHLSGSAELASLLTSYAEQPAIFNQKAPADTDPLWRDGAQYGRVIFALDTRDDPARALCGNLVLEAQSCDGDASDRKSHGDPDEMETLLRELTDGCFFSDGTQTMAAQWAESRGFTVPTEPVHGVTLTFQMLAFPAASNRMAKLVARMNQWTANSFDGTGLLVINHDQLSGVWKPDTDNAAIYWRVISDKAAGWIPDTHQTAWRTATLRGHVFAPSVPASEEIALQILHQLACDKRLLQTGESPIIVDRDNRFDPSADALRSGQIQVEATYGEIVRPQPIAPLAQIHYSYV